MRAPILRTTRLHTVVRAGIGLLAGALAAVPAVASSTPTPTPAHGALSATAPPSTPPATLDLPSGHFVTLAFHDVRDGVEPAVDTDPYAISTQRLAAWFDWMAANDWHPISLDDIEAARRQAQALPPNAVLLSFDDGLASLYQRVYPLLQAFDYPALFAIETGWLETVDEGRSIALGDAAELSASALGNDASLGQDDETDTVRYNGGRRGKAGFVEWGQLREMQASNLVEIASHTHDLHRGALANPQGNVEPAALARVYDPVTGHYERDAAYRQRVREDLEQSAAIIERHTGTRPRALVWPYGATSQVSESLAREAGYRVTFNLGDAQLATPSSGPAFGRLLVMDNPDPVTLEAQIAQTVDPPPRIQRAVQIDLDMVYDPDPAQVNANLSALLDRIKAMQVRTVYLQAFADPDGDGTASSLYFPNAALPMRADLFNRVAWQLKTRAGVDVYAWLPLLAFDLPDAERQRRLSVQIADGQGGRRAADRDYRRLSPFRPRTVALVRGIYADLARSMPAIDGVLIHDDAYLADDEDAQACAPEARWPGSTRVIDDCRLTSRQKTQALIDFGDAVVAGARGHANLSNRFRVARNLYARVVLDPAAESRFAQALGPFLAHYDDVALMAMPYLDGTGQPPEAWLDDLVDRVMAHPRGLEKTVFELQTYDWSRKRWIDPDRLRDWMHRLVRRGALNLAYYPDDFIGGRPAFQPTFEGMSLKEFPYTPPHGSRP
ncbi:poly-beta-1,6-N-acetyl-D-glucosamine N-deacetylase PgaB [Salinicola halophilus]|uniref:poly-beta-1,6-N-acetyl-D-glucosamine N-deacetylase PgaB n=1 Tax=Salinicola halophilus TaxID=184065 RepID=UPI000DA17251|nr:poly-beta-1,6-N-acetyl-D-glucosamine N-deacetylase PgaB [Salinicola halophilus]